MAKLNGLKEQKIVLAYTFSHFGRKLENRVGNMGSGIFVQQAVLWLASRVRR